MFLACTGGPSLLRPPSSVTFCQLMLIFAPAKEMKENHKGTCNKLSRMYLLSTFKGGTNISTVKYYQSSFRIAVQSMTSQWGSCHTHAGNTIILWHETCGYRRDDSLERVSCLYFLAHTTELTMCSGYIIHSNSLKNVKIIFTTRRFQSFYLTRSKLLISRIYVCGTESFITEGGRDS